jgi:hypothetical protein
MTAASAAAFWKGNASRRRRASGIPKPAPPDLGTPETRARLQPPPWHGWPSELKLAAGEMDVAFRLRAEECRAKAQILNRIGGQPGEWSEHEKWCYRRYLGWLALMRAVGWPVQAIVGIVVDHEPIRDEWLLRQALRLWATGRVGR